MKKQKKIINETDFSNHQIEAIARCILPDVIALFESEQGQIEFANWLAIQEKLVE